MNGYRFELVFRVRVQTGKPPCKNWTPININFNLAREYNNLTYWIKRKFKWTIADYIYREMQKNPIRYDKGGGITMYD